LVFHLYLNAFEGRQSVFIREGGEHWRNSQLRETGSCRLLELRLADGRDLLAGAEHELVPQDHTQLRVTLPTAVAPGHRILLRARFVSVLPALVVRSGFAADYALWGQFFPKLAKLEADGHFESFPYHGLGEFYADFADYELQLELPQAQRLACNADLVRSETRAALRTDTYRGNRLLDVACVSGQRLHVFSFEADHEPRIDVVAEPSFWLAARRQAALARFALRYLGARLGPYPYAALRIAIAPPPARAAAGMEFPGLVTTWGVRTTPPGFFAAVEQDAAVAHEIAHQWFPGLVATHEVRSPWLDEGLAQWLGADVQRAWYAQRSPLARWLWPDPDPFTGMRALSAATHVYTSSLQPAYSYDLPQLVQAVYVRPALLLEAVRKRWGSARLLAALGQYARTHRFGHPTQAQLFESFDHHYWAGFSGRWLLPALRERQSELLP
jgi:hypothetical protein